MEHHIPRKDFRPTVEHPEFQGLLRRKRRFVVPLFISFMLFYFTLPVLSSFTDLLNTPVIGAITLAWVYAGAQFVMTWTLCHLYLHRAQRMDRDARQMREAIERGEL
jgi:uncharacterized membrane protein (DUF485 family)